MKAFMINNIRKGFCILIVIVLFTGAFSVAPVNAKTTTKSDYLGHKKYSFSDDDSQWYSVSLKSRSWLLFKFDDSTYMAGDDARIVIYDSNDNVVHSEYLDISFEENYVFTDYLPAGTYQIGIYGEYADEYSFYLYRCYDVKLKHVKKLKLNKSKLNLTAGYEKHLKVKVTPSDSLGTTKWKSSNKKVASVDKYGYVRAKKMGKATITVKRDGKKAKCSVCVNKDWTEIGNGRIKKLSTFVKNISGYKKAKWKSSRPSVVSVINGGTIRAYRHGKAKLTAKIKGKKYTLTVYSYDKGVIKNKTISALKDLLYVPSSFELNSVKYPNFRTCTVYYSALTRTGNRVYGAETGYYVKGRFYYYDPFDDD